MLFSDSLWQVVLVFCCAATGVAVGLAGLSHLVPYDVKNWLD